MIQNALHCFMLLCDRKAEMYVYICVRAVRRRGSRGTCGMNCIDVQIELCVYVHCARPVH